MGPVDIRRTTLVVRNIDRSLALYRDALGLSVIYDRTIRTGEGRAGQPPIRLVLLRANDTFVGALGLLQRLNQDAPPLQEPQKPQPGQVVVVINVKDLNARFPRVRAVPGVKVVEEPQRVAYPTPDGRSTIPVIFSAIYDPDGFFVELNRILGKPAGT